MPTPDERDLVLPTEPRREVTKEGDLSNIMRQIEELERNKERSKAQAAEDSGPVTSPAAEAQSSHPPHSPRDEAAARPPISPPSPGPAPSQVNLEQSHPEVGYEYLGTVPPKPPSLAAPEWLHSIAEVVSRESKYYGALFKLGSIVNGKAHGYILKEKGLRDYVTVSVDHIEVYSIAKVKAKECCSPQWMSENMRKNNE